MQVAQKAISQKNIKDRDQGVSKALQRLGCRGEEAQPDAAAEPGTMAAAGPRPAVPSMELLRVAENRIEMVQPARLASMSPVPCAPLSCPALCTESR